MRTVSLIACGLVMLPWLVACAAEDEVVPDETEQTDQATPQEPLSEQQKADIETLLARAEGFLIARDRLQKVIVLPEQEALAEALAGHASDDDLIARRNVRFLLRLRARAGVKGKYLETVAAACMDELEAGIAPNDLTLVDAYVDLYPDDEKMKDRLLVWAKGNARIDKLPKGDGPRDTSIHRVNHARLLGAWSVPVKHKVLRVGMAFAEATDILGPPTSSGHGPTTWYYESMMHVNPYFRVWSASGTITKLQVYRQPPQE